MQKNKNRTQLRAIIITLTDSLAVSNLLHPLSNTFSCNTFIIFSLYLVPHGRNSSEVALFSRFLRRLFFARRGYRRIWVNWRMKNAAYFKVFVMIRVKVFPLLDALMNKIHC